MRTKAEHIRILHALYRQDGQDYNQFIRSVAEMLMLRDNEIKKLNDLINEWVALEAGE